MTIEELTMVYFAERHLEGIRDYMVRGRSFGDLTEEQLGAQWVKTYRAACDLDDDRSWDELIDLQRRQCVSVMHELSELAAGKDQGNRVAQLLIEGAMLHLQADLDWLERCQEELA